MSDFAMATQLWGACGKAKPSAGESLFGAYWRNGTAALGITAMPDDVTELQAKYADLAPATRDERGRLIKAAVEVC